MRTLSHDGIARFETLRSRHYTEQWQFVGPGCRECGMTNRTPKGRSFLFEYGTQSDGLGARIVWDGKYFCSKGCRDAHA